MTSASIAIPTSGRTSYLAVTLASIAPQARAQGAELLVVGDGAGPETAALAERHGARLIDLGAARGLNAARNAALAATTSELIVFTDDDVEAPSGWLAALLAGAGAYPGHEALGGPIRPWLEGGGPPHCGREPAPITSLDLGAEDRDAVHVWGANMAVRRSAVERIGGFDERLAGRGDEEEWLDRLHAAGGRVRYLAAAGLEHRREARDAGLAMLALAAYRLGMSARANDVRKGVAPPLARELRDLSGAGWHLVARRCAYGAVFAAHAAGRIQETVAPGGARPASPPPPPGPAPPPGPPPATGPAPAIGAPGIPASRDAPAEFLSGESGYVAGVRAVTRARLRDGIIDATSLLSHRRLARDAAQWTRPQRVLVAAIERTDRVNLLQPALAELRASRHAVRIVRTGAGDRGRFENFNTLISAHRAADDNWLILIDDDVRLPAGFLDRFLFLAQRGGLSIAQPAHRAYSHAAWAVTRRRAHSAVRETDFVEIGPVVAFHATTFAAVLPFPELRVGWGVDAHWAALARAHGWRIGVIDATPIEHSLRAVGASYDHTAARAESAAFLAEHPHISASDAGRTLVTHRIW